MEDKIAKTIKVLKQGGLVIFPSDSVYGALVDATNEKAVKKLNEFKARPPGKAISVFVSGFNMINDLVEVSDQQNKILKEILPGPFTVILKSKRKVSKLLESEKGTLGVRFPMNRFIKELTTSFGRPITATSANLFGYPPHYSVESLLKRLPKEKQKIIDFIVDAGKLPHNKPSTVIDLTEPEIKILREGELGFKKVGNYFSKSPAQTKKISQFILEKYINNTKTKPLIFIIKGDLGVGKTIFVKGIGEYLGVKDIVSPSYVIYYEYSVLTQSINKLIHIDLYNIEDKDEFSHLKLEQYFNSRNILCFEWGEKVGEIYKQLKKTGEVVFVEMKYINKSNREITIQQNIK